MKGAAFVTLLGDVGGDPILGDPLNLITPTPTTVFCVGITVMGIVEQNHQKEFLGALHCVDDYVTDYYIISLYIKNYYVLMIII
jgi:hypothetical protein